MDVAWGARVGWNGMQKRNWTASDWTLGFNEVVSRVPRIGDAVASALLQGGRRGAERARGGVPGPYAAGSERLHPGKT